MLTFPKEYYETEVREGFAVNELMKRTWAAQLEVLHKIIDICEKHHLTYYAYWGTLLGAVRHHGYIPWDDDLDIAMKRDDYIKFIEVVKSELPAAYCIMNVYEEITYGEVFTRVVNRHSIDFSEKELQEYHGCPFSVGVDIFPLYYLPRDKADRKVQVLILKTIASLCNLSDAQDLARSEGKKKLAEEYNIQLAEGLVELQKITSYQFTVDRPIRNQLLILYDQMSRLFGEEESDSLTLFPNYLSFGYEVNKVLLKDSILLPFENLLLNAPKEYDNILRMSYGDYMVPRRVRAAHDYPFYKEQLQLLGKYIEQNGLKDKEKDIAVSELIKDDRTGQIIPKEWEKKIYYNTAEGQRKRKKIILYHTSAEAILCHGEFVLEKLRYVWEVFKGQQEVTIWWMPCLLDGPKVEFVNSMSPQVVRDYQHMLEEFQNAELGICDVSGDEKRALTMADAYYGDDSELMQKFVKAGKCVMLQDYELI